MVYLQLLGRVSLQKSDQLATTPQSPCQVSFLPVPGAQYAFTVGEVALTLATT